MLTPTPCTLRLQGRVELRGPGGELLRLPTRPTALVLAMLSLGGEWLRDELAAAVWEGMERKTAREGLRTALSALRKLLPPGAIRSEGDGVSLAPGAVVVDSFEVNAGEFMPGHETAWAIDRRLALRARFVAELLSLADQVEEPSDALVYAERACDLDPLDARAEAMRTELLNRLGRIGEAKARTETHQARVAREFGAEVGRAEDHPLVLAVEWSLARDPREACNLLAGVQEACRGLSVERALRLYRSVLSASPQPSSARRVVESGEAYFSALADPFTIRSGRLRSLYQTARREGESVSAALLADALTYGNLSLGEFDSALNYATAGLDLARSSGDRTRVVRAMLNLGIVRLHVGDLEGSFGYVDAAVEGVEADGNPLTILEAHNTKIGFLTHRKRYDVASGLLQQHRKRIAEYGSERLYAWTYDLEGKICEETGDLEGARAAYLRFRDLAPAAGQCAIATADDGLMRVRCALGEYDEAADALARNVVFRRRKGSVQSKFERETNAPALRTLRERLDDDELRAAFRRAKSAAA